MNLLKTWIEFFKGLFERKNPPRPPVIVPPVIPSVEGRVIVLDGILPSKGMIFPDVSRYRAVDFDKFKGRYLATKATESNDWVDTTFRFNANECKKRGIQLYVYHFYRWEVDPIEQAEHFLNTINGYDVYKPLIVDYETANKQDHNNLIADLDDLKIFIRHVNKATDSKMIIYSGESLLNNLPFDEEFLELCGNPWIANYSRKPRRFSIWGKMWAWQFTSKYKDFDGLDKVKGVDANEFFNE